MQILLDSCVSSKIGTNLSANGHTVDWVGNWSEDPGDDTIMAHAFAHEQILITLDKDFGELAIIKQIPHHGIIRLVNISLKDQSRVCIQILNQYGNELFEGAIVTATIDRVRIRPADKD